METPFQDVMSKRKSHHDDKVISYLEAVKVLKQRSSISVFLVPKATKFLLKDDPALNSEGSGTSKQKAEGREDETTKKSTLSVVSKMKSEVTHPKYVNPFPKSVKAPSPSREVASEYVDGSTQNPAEKDVKTSNRPREVQNNDWSRDTKNTQYKHSDNANPPLIFASQCTDRADEDNATKNVPQLVKQLSAQSDVSVITIDETKPEAQKRARGRASSQPKSYNLRQRRRPKRSFRDSNKASERRTKVMTITIPDAHAEVQEKVAYVLTEVAKSFNCIVNTRETGMNVADVETRRTNAPGMVYVPVANLPMQTNPFLPNMSYPTGPRARGNQSRPSAKNMAAMLGYSNPFKTLEMSSTGHEGLFYPEVILKEEK